MEDGFYLLAEIFAEREGVEISTMMGTPCLRHNGDFFSMMFEKEDALIIKVSPDRVNQLIDSGIGMEFNFTKKKFKEWVLIPREFEHSYKTYIEEALSYLQAKA